MNIDEYTRIRHKKKNSREEDELKKIKYLRNLITRVLISIILIISICIFIKLDENNLLLVDEYIFKDSLKFTKINNWYQNKFGELLPNVSDSTELVFSSSDFMKNSYNKYSNGVKINLSKSTPISVINGGIVVFIGEKDEYGNTIIIQGNDGIDYWYGGITNVGVNLYDYLKKDTLIGEASDNFIYLVLEKNGEYLDYEEYIN